MRRRYIGSDMTKAAARQAAAASTGTKSMTFRQATGMTHPGNKAGLKNAKTARIVPENSGYLNPANQTARRGMKASPMANAPHINNAMQIKRLSGTLNDTRALKSTDSAMAKLIKFLK